MYSLLLVVRNSGTICTLLLYDVHGNLGKPRKRHPSPRDVYTQAVMPTSNIAPCSSKIAVELSSQRKAACIEDLVSNTGMYVD
jgi:hypothetical protein